MRRDHRALVRTVVVAGAVLAGACRADDEPTAAEPVTVEIFHADTDNVLSTRAPARLAALPGELSRAPVDILCLQGIGDPTARAAIKRALADAFPVSLDLPTSDDTTVDDDTDAFGAKPAGVELRPPCADQSGAVAQVVARLESGCLAEPGGVALGTPCIARRFDVPESAWDADPERRCRSCIAGHLRAGMRARETVARCREKSRPLVLGGQHGTMILSKLPLSSPSIHVLPSEGTRRVVIGANATTRGGDVFAVFCASLGPTSISGLATDPDVTEPYPGPYGAPRDGWLRENELQVAKLVAHVERVRAGLPAIVLGNFGAGREIVRSGVSLVGATGDAAAMQLDSSFVPVPASAAALGCTICPDNSLASFAAAPSSLNRVYLAGMRAEQAAPGIRTALGAVVGPDEHSDVRVPLSTQYGFRTTILVR